YLQRMAMRIMQTLVQSKSARGGLEYRPPKGNKTRTVDLDGDTYKRERDHFERQGRILAEHGIKQTRDTPLFARADGTPQPPSWYTDSFRALAKQLGLESGVHLHTLRHTHATYLIEECDVSLNEIQARFGHCNISVTLKNYGHLLPGSGREAAHQFAMLAASKRRKT
ncbi:MAG: tyrosine-type recombinase/integrase, partial [Gordonibacter sp.]|uniref:tyrosine-type recombinase/integrase n=1 Tax=Gordonibacter sp. TaxID=1968902 RepID=UPI002FC90211